MRVLIFHKDHLQTDNAYMCSRKQARAILGQTKKRKIYYQQDTRYAGGDNARYVVRRVPNGWLEIGCMAFSKKEVALIRRWLRGQKVRNQKP